MHSATHRIARLLGAAATVLYRDIQDNTGVANGVSIDIRVSVPDVFSECNRAHGIVAVHEISPTVVVVFLCHVFGRNLPRERDRTSTGGVTTSETLI